MAHKKGLTQLGFIGNSETNKSKKLAEIMSQYANLVRKTEDNKTAGLLPLIVLIERSENENLDDTHHKAWQFLTEATIFDQEKWVDNTPKDPSHPEFIYTFAGEQWFINVSSYCHKKRKSRNLGSHIILAMQTLHGSNRFYRNKEDKLSWQKRIRERTEQYDGMAVYEGLGVLEEIGDPRPLVESYFLPDTNDEAKGKFWERKMRNIEIILFDFDGTLADTARCGVEATQEAFIQCGLVKPSEQAITHAMGIPIEKSFKDFGAIHFTETEFENLLACFRKIYAEKADSLIAVFDGTLPLLKKLKEANKKIAIVSSKKSDVLRKNAEFLSIAQYIDLFVGSDLVNHYKPHPEGIFVALKHFDYQGDLSQVLYVGDASSDIEMGHQANIKTCAVTWGAHSEENLLKANPNYLVHSFEELEKIILKSGCPFHQI